MKRRKKPTGQSFLFAELEEDVKPPKIKAAKGTKVLALDIATATGFCTATAWGTWDFSLKRDETKGMRLIRFRAKLQEIVRLEEIKLIVYESPAVYGKHPNFVAIEMIGVLKVFCEENKIDLTFYAPASIKKYATGSGKATKPQMIKAAELKYGGVTNDNEADALHLYHLAIDDLLL